METYLGNPNLKKANVAQEWTQEEVTEYSRCMNDPMYWMKVWFHLNSMIFKRKW